VIDLIGDEPKAMAPAGLGDLGNTPAKCHAAGRVIRACEQKARGSFPGEPLDIGDGRHPAPLA
jgi:hypothetical protein